VRLDNVWKDMDTSHKKAAVEGRLRSMIVSAGNLFMCVRCQLVLGQLNGLLEEAAIKASHDAAARARAAFDAWLKQAFSKMQAEVQAQQENASRQEVQ
jgi:hypothetical protein